MLTNFDSIFLKTSKPIKFCEVELVIDYLGLLPELNSEMRNFSINTKDKLTRTQIKCFGNASKDDIQIIKKYIMETLPNLNIVDIYYVKRETI